MLTKTIGISTKDYKISMTSPLKFFEDDDLELYFQISEFGVIVVDNEETEVETPLFPEYAILFVETSRRTDTIESVNIEENKVCFRLTSKYTNKENIGIGRMQIVLFDGANRKALPPFEFEIQPVIYQPITYNGLANEEGIALLTEDVMLLDGTDEVYGIKISELPYTEEVLGYIPIVQYGVTKQIEVNTILDTVVDKVDEAINEEIPVLIDSKIQESIENDISVLIDVKIEEAVGTDLNELIDRKIEDSLEYDNPASTTITDFKSALDYLLYYDLVITFNCNRTTILEIGTTISSVTFNWSYNKNILSQSFNGTGINNDIRTYTYDTPFSNNKDFKITATDERKSFSKTISFAFRYGRYWGVSSSENLDGDGIASLNKELSTTRGKSFTVNANEGEYIYYCYPMSWGVGTFSVGGFTGGFELVNNISFTNSQGHTSTYYVYRSTNHSLGNTAVTVS